MDKARKYLPSFAELIDRLTITQQKECKIPENKLEYAKEIYDIIHDIQLFLDDYKIKAEDIQDIVVLALINSWIWQNESNIRKGIKENNDLELTHGLNSIRCEAKNRIQRRHQGRQDVKSDYLNAPSNWVPSSYQQEK